MYEVGLNLYLIKYVKKLTPSLARYIDKAVYVQMSGINSCWSALMTSSDGQQARKKVGMLMIMITIQGGKLAILEKKLNIHRHREKICEMFFCECKCNSF